MIISTINTVPGKEITEILGVAKGVTVRTKHLVKEVMAEFKKVVGGEIVGHTSLLEDAQNQALGRLILQAKSMHADAVVNVRFISSAVSQGTSEVMVYGTAVKLIQS